MTSDALERLAARLAAEHEDILARWRATVSANEDASALATLTRSEFYDHIPDLLESISASFRAGLVRNDIHAPSLHHGAHRWQQGLSFEEVMTEWQTLHWELMDWVAVKSGSLDLNGPTLQRVYRLLAETIGQGITDSLSEFHSHQRLEAMARVRDLEAAIEERGEQEDRRSRDLRQTAHDLRGSLAAVTATCHLLKTRVTDEETRTIVERLGGAATALNQMCADLLQLARLEAGLETRTIADLDAADLLRELCLTLQPLAEAEGLAFELDGPGSLPVRADAVKLRRIAQNLVLNALKYTAAGKVEVSWRAEPAGHWSFQVSDTGAGLSESTAAALAAGLEDAGNDGGRRIEDIDEAAGPGEEPLAKTEPVATHGEGIGLLIVRQLCILLHGVLEVDTARGGGARFRVLLPTAYPTLKQNPKKSDQAASPFQREA